MNQKQLKKIQINNVTFVLDHQYQFVIDLITSKFEKLAFIIDQLYGRDDKVVKMLIESVLQDGCRNDIAMTYFITMVLQNYGEFERAGKIITQLYHDYPADLLARCAYANHLIFHEKFDEIPAIFDGTFDLEKLYSKRELPLTTYVHFMSVACTYYLGKKDPRNFMKYLTYLLENAPEHGETKGFLALLQKTPGSA